MFPSDSPPSDTPPDTIRKIKVVEYDPSWPKVFEEEAKRIKQALGCNCLKIHHMGSTSVPGLSAKPVIDMLPVVRDIREVDQAIKAMESLGYEAKGEYGVAFRRYFRKGGNSRTHNIHVYQENDPEISRYLKFRDWLRSHPEDAKNYAKLKAELAEKFPHDILGYSSGKDAFVASIDAKDGYEGWRIVKALTDREWEAVRRLRQNLFESKEDPFIWTFTHQDHVHFVFYKNAEIIGYAHLHFWPENRAALRMIVIDERYRKYRFGSQFLTLCERWLYHQGFRKLFIQSTDQASEFFRKHGYVEMPFKDLDGYEGDPRDTKIGKYLTMAPMDRPKISVYIAMSIDGYIARKDGSLDWLEYGHSSDEDYGFKNFISSVDALVLGRNTYEVVTGFDKWPYKGKRVIVLSKTLKEVREEAELFRGELADLASFSHSEGIRHIWVDGGITVSKFLEAELVDEMTISIIATILGSGIPLFSLMKREHKCRLISSQSYPSGLVQLKYEIIN